MNTMFGVVGLYLEEQVLLVTDLVRFSFVTILGLGKKLIHLSESYPRKHRCDFFFVKEPVRFIFVDV